MTKQITRRVGWLVPSIIGTILLPGLGTLIAFFAFSRLETITVAADWRPERAKAAPLWVWGAVLLALLPGLLFIAAKAVS